MTDPKPLQKVLREVQRWGVSVYMHAFSKDMIEEQLPWLKSESGNCAISWPDCGIWIQKPRAINPAELLHELAHCIVGEHPNWVYEIDSGMLAVEWYTQRRLRLGALWQRWQRNYNLGGENTLWPQASSQEKHAAVQTSLQEAVRRGLLTPSGQPTYRRAKIRE